MGRTAVPIPRHCWQSAYVRTLLKLYGPNLARVHAPEQYLPLLHQFGRLVYVRIWCNRASDEELHPINVLALSSLPALRTLRVQGRPGGTTHTHCLDELTQLDTLELKDTLPQDCALPAGLTSLKLSLD